MSTGRVYFITGANRGIGLQFANLYSANAENKVIVSTRDISKSKELVELAQQRSNISIVTLDISIESSIDGLDEKLAQFAPNGIDTFISNAGIANSYKTAIETDSKTWKSHWNTNSLGPILTMQAVYKHLLKRQTRQAVFISSLTGSIGGFLNQTYSAYGASKAALNYIVKELSYELQPQGFVVVAVHPGLVMTDMGKAGVDAIFAENPDMKKSLTSFTPQQAAKNIDSNIVSNLSVEKNGLFINYDGEVLTW